MSVGLVKAPTSTITVDRFDRTMSFRGPIADYYEVEVTWDWWDTPTGKLVIPVDTPHHNAIRKAAPIPGTRGDVVPIDVTVNGQRWSGRVDGWTEEKVDGSWRMSVDLIHESQWLGEILCWPAPAAGIGAQFPQQNFDSNTAPQLVRNYLQRNLDRAYGASSPVVIVPRVDGVDEGETFQLAARMTLPRDLFKEVLRIANRSVVVTRWRPGDPQPPGLNLTTPKVVVDVAAGRDRPHVMWDEGKGQVDQPKLDGEAPRAWRVITGGKSPDLVNNALRSIFSGLNFFDNVFGAFNVFEDTALRDALGPFAFLESFQNSGSGAFTLEALQAGRAGLVSNAGRFAASGVVLDGAPWTFGRDYLNGDRVAMKVRGTEYPAQVRSITAGRTRESQVYVHPVLGDKPAAEDPFDKQLRQLQSLITWVTAMNLGA